MKYTLPLLILLSSVLSAQPVIDSTDMYTANTSYISKKIHYYPFTIDLNNTGANSIWDFTNITFQDEFYTTYLDPKGTAGYFNFTESDLCKKTTSSSASGTSNSYTYLKTTSNSLSNEGTFRSIHNVIIYAPSIDIYRFPLTFNSSFTQPMQGTLYQNSGSVGYIYTRSGSQTVVCDGYGTLITPLGTYENVLRVKTQQIYTDSCFFNGYSIVNDYDRTIYNWVSAQNKGAALLTISTDFDPYINSLLPVGIEETSEELDFIFFPNPAKSQLFIQLPTSNSENLTAEIFSITGQLIKTINIDNQQSMLVNLDLNDIESGMYLLRLSDQKSSGIKRFVVM